MITFLKGVLIFVVAMILLGLYGGNASQTLPGQAHYCDVGGTSGRITPRPGC
jgi:hypothetical protein